MKNLFKFSSDKIIDKIGKKKFFYSAPLHLAVNLENIVIVKLLLSCKTIDVNVLYIFMFCIFHYVYNLII